MVLAELRAAVARIEAGLAPAEPRKTTRAKKTRSRRPALLQAGPATVERFSLGEGALPLDEILGGGLRRGTLHEILAAAPQDGGAAAGFAAALACRGAGTGPLVWIIEDCAASETGLPYRPGLIAQGLDPGRLLLVRTGRPEATLWAAEEALTARAPLVLAELWNSKAYGLAASRRLLLAAQAGRGTLLLLQAGLSGQAARLSSTAETRFVIAAHPSPGLPSAGHRLPIPGPSAFALRLMKLRLGGERAFDPARLHRLVWSPAKRCFDDYPVPFGVSAPAADRPAASLEDTPAGRGRLSA